MHLYVCPFVCKGMERKLYLYETPMYFSYFVYFAYIMLYYVVGVSLCQSFNFGNDILTTYQNSPKSVFIYLYGFKHLVLYNLVVCYSLDPLLVIWYVILIIFLQFKYISLN